jgi:hypothetical protein
VLKGSWNDTSLFFYSLTSLHGVCFSCTSLTIGKNSAIIPFQDRLKDGQSSLVENGLLLASGLKDKIKTEISLLLSRLFGGSDYNLAPIWNNIDNRLVLMQ